MPYNLRILFPMTLDPSNSSSLLQQRTSEIESKPYKTILRILLLKAEEYHAEYQTLKIFALWLPVLVSIPKWSFSEA